MSGDGGKLTARGMSTAISRVTISGGIGIVALVLTLVLFEPALAPAIGWIVAALCYLGWIWFIVGRMTPEETAAHSLKEDPTRGGADATLLVASAASLIAVGVVLIRAGHATGAERVLQILLATSSVVFSWLVTHTVYMLRYATIYHQGSDGGVDFNQDTPPRYLDFAYLAFTIGMTFQVSDTSLTSSVMRGTALRHALLSYLYGTVIIALTINLVAGLGR
jgi:uncharacterized membrane protein